MARTISFMQAINEALDQEMERDEAVVVFGEDVAGGSGSQGEEDAWGGVMGVTKGLFHKYPGRVLDTPITESSFIGAAGGAAASGLRPVAELMFNDFMGVCFDQVERRVGSSVVEIQRPHQKADRKLPGDDDHHPAKMPWLAVRTTRHALPRRVL